MRKAIITKLGDIVAMDQEEVKVAHYFFEKKELYLVFKCGNTINIKNLEQSEARTLLEDK